MSDVPLAPDALLRDAVRAIEQSRRRIAVVVDGDRRLLGTLTDGDIRRCLLDGGTLETSVSRAMATEPRVVGVGASDSQILDVMRQGNVMSVPRVDAEGRFLELLHLWDIDPEAARTQHARGFAAAVIMAGGMGTRLRPVTRDIPKPMVEIAGVPLLERLVRRLAAAGLRRVVVSVNYLGHVIEEHLGDGRQFGLSIEYLRETVAMGTAGALSLLPSLPDGPILVMNGDILTTSDFGSLYDFHESHRADMTVAAIEYRVEIPYGVLDTDGSRVTGLTEKPSQRFLCNAGIYSLSPHLLAEIPNRFYNMTDLLQTQIDKGGRVVLFPIHEFWSDIGTPTDLEQARASFGQLEQQ